MIYDFDDIQDYVLGKMSDADMQTFEQAMELDANLRLRVLAFQKETEAVRYLQRVALREKFAEWRRPNTSNMSLSSAKHGKKRWLLFWVCAALIVLFATLLLLFSNNTVDVKENKIMPSTPPMTIDSAPIAAKKPPTTNDVKWEDLGQSVHTVLIKKEYLMGSPNHRTLEDSIFQLISKKQMDRALALAFQGDTLESHTQLLIAHLYWSKRDYLQAAKWYAALKNNKNHMRFQMDAEINEIACYIAMYPLHRGELKQLLEPILKNPVDYPLRRDQKSALETVLKQL